MKILSIDPGATGFYVVLDTDDMIANAYRIEWDRLKNLQTEFSDHWPDVVVTEKLGALPKQMAKKCIWSMGMSYGQILHAIRDLPKEFVSPKSWQKVCLEGTCASANTKLRSIEAFVKLNPEFINAAINHNMADAFHIARYWMLKSAVLPRKFRWLVNAGISMRLKK